jgi:membrane protein implicated in regulation of membrane protease activity
VAKLFVVLSQRTEVVEVDGKRWRVRCEQVTN